MRSKTSSVPGPQYEMPVAAWPSVTETTQNTLPHFQTSPLRITGPWPPYMKPPSKNNLSSLDLLSLLFRALITIFLELFLRCTWLIPVPRVGSNGRSPDLSLPSLPNQAQGQAHNKCSICLWTNYVNKTTVLGHDSREEIELNWKITDQLLLSRLRRTHFKNWEWANGLLFQDIKYINFI